MLLSSLQARSWDSLASLRDALLCALGPVLPAGAPRDAHLERARALNLLLALDGPGAPSLDALHWLGPDEPASLQGRVLEAMDQGERVLPLPLLRESWERWMGWIARDRAGWWGTALRALLSLLWRAGGADEVRRAQQALPEAALDRLLAGVPPLPPEIRALLYARWSSGAPREELSWRQAAYATLDQPISRRWILESPEPLDEGLWLQAQKSLHMGPEEVLSFFEGYPERFAEACERLLLPVPILAAQLDPVAWSERLLRAFAQERAALRARQDQLSSFQVDVGDTVQILVLEAVQGGFSVLVARDDAAPCVQGFLPGSHADDAQIGASVLATVTRLPQARAQVVVSRRAWQARGEQRQPDERTTERLQAAGASGDPALGPAWPGPFSKARAVRLISGWEALTAVRQTLLEEYPTLRAMLQPSSEAPSQRALSEERGTLEALLEGFRVGPGPSGAPG